jgi:hypothetical protein
MTGASGLCDGKHRVGLARIAIVNRMKVLAVCVL